MKINPDVFGVQRQIGFSQKKKLKKIVPECHFGKTVKKLTGKWQGRKSQAPTLVSCKHDMQLTTLHKSKGTFRKFKHVWFAGTFIPNYLWVFNLEFR